MAVAGNLDLSHLAPQAREAAMLSDEERIMRIRSDRWIGYPRALEAIDRLEELLNWPRKQRMPNMLIVGPTNNGKSMIVERFRRMQVAKATSGSTDHEPYPIVCVQMPAVPSVSRFYGMVLDALNTPVRPKARAVDLEQLAVRLMRGVQARMLIIDELHNLLAGKTFTQREFLNVIRFLGNELRIPIVGIGTREAYLAIRSDDQLENRFEPFTLPVWKEGPELVSLLASYAAMLPLRRSSPIATAEVAKYVIARTEGTIGEIARMVSAAAIAAIRSGGEHINQSALTTRAFRSPSERRRAFERELA